VGKFVFGEYDCPVVFYDGHCGLCDAYVQWLVRWDRNEVFLFAPLGGATGTELKSLYPELPAELDSLVLWEPTEAGGGTVRWYSDAVLGVTRRLGWPWRMGVVFSCVPRGLRDRIYRALASVRYRIFGRRDQCRVPTPAQASRFLP
jgi:predicted DCC family thiol-disulfide oxidoreductase YuxK